MTILKEFKKANQKLFKKVMKKDLQLCSFEQAKKLKEDGFNWETDYGYFDDGELVYICKFKIKLEDMERFPCPSIQHALMFYRKVKGISSCIHHYEYGSKELIEYFATIYKEGEKIILNDFSTSYEEMENTLLSKIQKLNK